MRFQKQRFHLHLLLQQCDLDEVWFIPTDISPFKKSGSQATNAQRLDMLRLAIASQPGFSINELEWKRGGVSYTYETLETLTEKHPDHEFFLLMGADSLADFPQWKNPQRICELATLAIVSRAGNPAPDLSVLSPLVDNQYLKQVTDAQIKMPAMDLSSSEIRRRIALQQSIRFQIPRGVEQYIKTQGLYLKET